MAHKEPKRRKSLWRRLLTPKVLAFFAVVAAILLGVFWYFYVVYSQMIDAKLSGNLFVRSTAIYAAPVRLTPGPGMSRDEMIAYLRRVGYVEAGSNSEADHGRYAVRGNDVEVTPDKDSVAGSGYLFGHIRVSFESSGKGVKRIVDLATRQGINAAYLEPEVLSSISAEKHQKRKVIEFKDIPPVLVKAVLAAEDRRFFDHSGIDYRGIIRALWENASEGEVRQGGSTITQQLVKNFFLTRERTWRRKFADAYLALILETRLSKQQIFVLYCNDVFLGQQGSYSINGFGEAAKVYFDKDVINLSLPEAAFLAGINRGPSYYSPYTHRDRALSRRNQVLEAMVANGAITEAQADAAKRTELKVLSKQSSSNRDAPYFLDYLQNQIAESLASRDFVQESYRIYSTVDMQLQRAADQAVHAQMERLDKYFASRKKNALPPGSIQASLCALDPRTGDVLAMVGGRDYGTTQYNRAIESKRQPGSVFKPVVYAAALNTAYDEDKTNVITAASRFLDAPETFVYGNGQTYSPGNFADEYSNREVTLREAITRSLNVVTIRVAEKTGYTQVERLSEKFGYARSQAYPSLALGVNEATPLDVARAYTTFPGGGSRVDPTGIKRVVTSTGESVMESSPKSTPVISPQVSWLLTDMMRDVLDRGTAARTRELGFTALAAGKTGTSHDGWFAGFTPNLVCVVWVGFDDNTQLGLTGAQSALPIWTEFMKRALQLRPDLAGTEFTKPDGITSAEIDPETGLLASETCSTRRTEYFIGETAPTQSCSTAAHDSLRSDNPQDRPAGREEPPPRKTDQPLRRAALGPAISPPLRPRRVSSRP